MQAHRVRYNLRETPEAPYSRNTFAATLLFASLTALLLALASLTPAVA